MNEITNLQNIERRISYHIQGAYQNILEVGRCLIEAKDSGLVKHGEWEAWVQRTTGMSERNAQRLMQAAREVAPDSAMAKLPITKIQTILALPEPEREAIAEKAVAENMSLRKLQNEVDGLRKIKLAAEREARQANQRADNAERSLERAMGEANRYRRDMEIIQCEKQALQAELEGARELLHEQIEAAKVAPATGISAEAQAEIGRLKAALADAEQMAEYQAEQRQQAQRELMEIKGKAARGDVQPVEDLTAESVAVAVKVFIGTVGWLPHSEKLTAMGYQDRQQVHAFARMIGKWAADVQNTLDNINEAIVIMEARHHE